MAILRAINCGSNQRVIHFEILYIWNPVLNEVEGPNRSVRGTGDYKAFGYLAIWEIDTGERKRREINASNTPMMTFNTSKQCSSLY